MFTTLLYLGLSFACFLVAALIHEYGYYLVISTLILLLSSHDCEYSRGSGNSLIVLNARSPRAKSFISRNEELCGGWACDATTFLSIAYFNISAHPTGRGKTKPGKVHGVWSCNTTTSEAPGGKTCLLTFCRLPPSLSIGTASVTAKVKTCPRGVNNQFEVHDCKV